MYESTAFYMFFVFSFQSLPFDVPGSGEVPQDLYQSLYWLWCAFNQVAEIDTYPPSADHEEVSINLTGVQNLT